MEFKDCYQAMGVGESATPEEIKRAHRKLARKYQPDVSTEKNAEARFKELAEVQAQAAHSARTKLLTCMARTSTPRFRWELLTRTRGPAAPASPHRQI